MSRSSKISDAALFAALMRDTKPLARKVKVIRPAPASSARAAKKESLVVSVAPTLRPSALRAPSQPPAPNPGIDRRTAERLRKGRMDIDRRLDLHGLTQEAAHAALDRAVATAWRDGVRVLLVITGKGSMKDGGGVVRRNLPRWLAVGANAPRVLRIESAQPQHGGAGAFYVLLRRQRS
jgi:DNA-nicking Smr family endonuclease